MDWGHLYTSFEGRINRGKYWAGMAVLWVVSGVISTVVRSAMSDSNESVAFWAGYFVVVIIVGLAGLAVQIKRWHDRGKSGWWVLIFFIPIVGPIWAIIETGFLAGTAGPNEYGPDPLAET